MRADLPAPLSGCFPESVLNNAVRLSKELLRKQTARIKGDKSVIDSAIFSAWVASFRHDTCGIAPYKDENQDYSELLFICVQLNNAVSSKQILRLQELLHIAVPYPLLLALDAGDALHLSILPSNTPVELVARVQLADMLPELKGDLSLPSTPPDSNLLSLFNRWQCAICAAHLAVWQPAFNVRIPYRRLSDLQAASNMVSDLRELERRWRETSFELRRAKNPQDRIRLSNNLFDFVSQAKSLIKIRLIPIE